MSVVRNPQVEERQPALIEHTTDAIFAQLRRDPGANSPLDAARIALARLLERREVTQVPNSPVGEKTKSYLTHFVSRDKVLVPKITGKPGALTTSNVSLLMQALHGAFAEHVPFSIAPETAWYMIVHEVAIHIRLNAEHYRGYFTASAKKGTLEARDDSLKYGSSDNQWGRFINKFRDQIVGKVPKATIQLLLPQFSSSSFESDTALLVLFLDIVANYYDLWAVTLCGVPAVRVEGTVADWQTIVHQAEMVQHEFSGLTMYFNDLLPVLREIAGTIAGQEPDPEFWASIYKYKDGSGGPYINGWITSFFAHRVTSGGFVPRQQLDWRTDGQKDFGGGLTSSDLPVHLSRVPFVWKYLGRKIPMAFMAGMMGVEYDGYLNPKLGYAVLEDLQK